MEKKYSSLIILIIVIGAIREDINYINKILMMNFMITTPYRIMQLIMPPNRPKITRSN